MWRLTLLLLLCLGFFPEAVRAQQAPSEVKPAATPSPPAAASESPAGTPEQTSAKIGRLHDNLRRSKASRAAVRGANTLYDRYSDFKNQLEKEFGLSWSADVSYLQQWGWPDGGSPAGQFLTTPNIDWTFLKGKRFGEGSLQVSYITSRYFTTQTAADVSSNLDLITLINDFPIYQNVFAQLTYTQAFPGDKILVTIGQYPIYNFDANQYLANQQQNFNSYIFAQNGSSTYPNAGLGAYAQVNLSKTVQLAAGLQNASDITGASLYTRDFGRGGYAWFTYLQWTPQFRGLGSAQYSFLYYQVPTVQDQPFSTGWSVNAVQNLNSTWAFFTRANQAADDVTSIRRSFALGAAMNNPLGRSQWDQIGVAVGYSSAAGPPANPAGARDEKVIETYWNWNVFGGLLLTPGVQFVIDPALAPHRDNDWVLSLRATLML